MPLIWSCKPLGPPSQPPPGAPRWSSPHGDPEGMGEADSLGSADGEPLRLRRCGFARAGAWGDELADDGLFEADFFRGGGCEGDIRNVAATAIDGVSGVEETREPALRKWRCARRGSRGLLHDDLADAAIDSGRERCGERLIADDVAALIPRLLRAVCVSAGGGEGCVEGDDRNYHIARKRCESLNRRVFVVLAFCIRFRAGLIVAPVRDDHHDHGSIQVGQPAVLISPVVWKSGASQTVIANSA